MKVGRVVMAKRATEAVGSVLRAAVRVSRVGVTDQELLRRYADANDQAAFTALVSRHTGMVLGVCRRVLANQQDAEDACQATFLVLARKAKRGRWQPSVANWLYTTARKVARNARVVAQRRAKRERRAAVPDAEPLLDEMTGRELLAVLDEELDRLPPHYREPLVLCYLEGLTRDEAARRLSVPAATLKAQLERGRKRLGEALTRRGCALGAGLLAVAASSPAGASPPRLVQAVLAAAAGSAPAAVAALAKGVAVNGMVYKSVLASVAVIGVVALGIGLASVGPSAAGQPVSVAADTGSRTDADGQLAATPEEVTYTGRVLGPDGQPFAGAKLYVLYYTPKVLPIPQRGTSGPDGSFRFAVARQEFDRSIATRPWDEAVVVAVAEGYGLGVPFYPFLSAIRTPVTLRLTKDDVPITGRVLDLQGRPVAGVSGVVHDLWWPTQGKDPTAWHTALRVRPEWYPVLHEHLVGLSGRWMGRDIGRIFPPTVTDAEGRFRLRGVGRERVVALRLEGAAIVTTELWAATRPIETLRVNLEGRDAGEAIPVVGATFAHVAVPCRPIVGVVRGKDTGRPISGAVVEGRMFAGSNFVERTQVRAVTDRDGRYRLLGMPAGAGNQFRVTPPEDQPYLMTLARAPDEPGLETVTVDVELKRGVWITGRVTDKVTGQPVPSWIHYAVSEGEPDPPGAVYMVYHNTTQTNPQDGTFRFVGLPGEVVISARAQEPRYTRTEGEDIDRLLVNRDYHTAAVVRPARGVESATCDLALVPGRMLAVTVVGPDGQPLAGALVRGLQYPDVWGHRLTTPGFSMLAPTPEEPRLLQVVHPEKNLAGSLVMRGDEPGPLTVRLGPAGVLTGRFVTTDGKPLADLHLSIPPGRSKSDVTIGSFLPGPRTDEDGKFRIEGLAPGLTYSLALLKGHYLLQPDGDMTHGVTVKPGETKDLGDVKIKRPGP